MKKNIIKLIGLCLFLLLNACATQQENISSTIDLVKLGKEAAAAYDNKNWQVAEKKYSQIISESPGLAEMWFRLGNIFARTSRPDKAIAAYKEAVIRQSDFAQAWRNLGIMSLRQTAHIYIEMLQYLDSETENYIRAKKTGGILLKLIKKNQEKNNQSQKIKDALK